MTHADDTPAPAAPVATKSFCGNCGAELLGPYCYVCGQPVKGSIRPLTSMLHDIADTILNIDSRIFRTLLPLLLRPGFLTNEYLAGRRVRYDTPFRLYFFLSVASFLLMQFSRDATRRSDRRDRTRAHRRGAAGRGGEAAGQGRGQGPRRGRSAPQVPQGRGGGQGEGCTDAARSRRGAGTHGRPRP